MINVAIIQNEIAFLPSVSTDLKQQPTQKLLKAPSFGIQLEESTDVNGESQFMVFCRFPDIEAKKMVKHYLFCQPVEEKAIAETIFKKMSKFLKKESITELQNFSRPRSNSS